MSAVSDIADLLADLRRLSERNPEALARRDQILAAKRTLVARIEADGDAANSNPRPPQ
ncbi:MAG: hypothetical protein ACR2G7_10040 [Acidimicrobiales bacterium]